jgi:hypothetical protein
MARVEIPADSALGLANLPYGVCAPTGGPPGAGVRVATRCSTSPTRSATRCSPGRR